MPTFLPPDPYALQFAELDRRQKMADLLKQQSMQPIEVSSYNGIQAPISPLSGLAKVLQAYKAGQEQKDILSKQEELAQNIKGQRTQDIRTMLDLISGSPGSEAIPEMKVEPGLNLSKAVPAVPARAAGVIDPTQLAEALGKIQSPDIQSQLLNMRVAQLQPQTPIKLGAGETLVDPRTFKPVYETPVKAEFGQPVREIVNGQAVTVAYDKQGNRKVIDTGGAVPAVSPDTQARLDFDKYKFQWEKDNPGYTLQSVGGVMYKVNTRTAASTPLTDASGKFIKSDAGITQNLAERKFAFEKANPGYEYKEDAAGNVVAINKRTNKVEPVLANNEPMKAKSSLSESQGAATNYGMRMSDANKLLTDLENKDIKNTGITKGIVGTTVGLMPFVGDKLANVTDNIFNVLPEVMGGLSPEQQQTMNARINFVTAVLRKESGASISPGEFSTAEKLYFPSAGDSPSVIKQKQMARESAIKGMKIQAGSGAQNITEESPWRVVR